MYFFSHSVFKIINITTFLIHTLYIRQKDGVVDDSCLCVSHDGCFDRLSLSFVLVGASVRLLLFSSSLSSLSGFKKIWMKQLSRQTTKRNIIRSIQIDLNKRRVGSNSIDRCQCEN